MNRKLQFVGLGQDQVPERSDFMPLSMADMAAMATIYLSTICLRSRPGSPNVVRPSVSSNVENSDQMTV